MFLHLANQHIKSWIKSALIPAMVSASVTHTVLLRTDGNAVAIGSNDRGQCNVPPLAVGTAYIQVAARVSHTVLLRSDGHAVAAGDNGHGRCNIPPFHEGMLYIHTDFCRRGVMQCFSGVMAVLLLLEIMIK